MDELRGQRAVIFGASSGVGLATAKRLAAHGAEVILSARRKDEVEQAASTIAGAKGFAVDGRDLAAVNAFFASVGEFDHLVIPAGATNRGGPFVDMTMDAFRATFEGKFWVQMNAAHAGARHVRRGGSITFFSGGAAHRALRGMVNVAAVNASLEAVVPALSLELAPTRVNAISPGTLATTYWAGTPEDQLKAIFDRTAAALPAGRVGTAEDIASAVLFIVCNGFVTGTVVQVDGGIAHANMP